MFGLGGTKDNAIDLLKRDHKEVDAMFKEYEAAKEGRPAAREKIVRQICAALTVHATIEEEIFYPVVRREVKDAQDLISEAAVEHQTLKDIIARLEAAPVKDPLYDAGVKVLSEYVKHHVKEEENELFPKVESSAVDLLALGQQLIARKTALEGKQDRHRTAA